MRHAAIGLVMISLIAPALLEAQQEKKPTDLGSKAQAKKAAECVGRARKWLLAAQPVETEDRVWHLFGLKWSGTAPTVWSGISQLWAPRRSSHAQQPRRSSPSSLRGASLRNGFVLTCLSAPSASCCRLRGRGPWSGGRYALWIPDSEHESGRWPRPWLASHSRQ